MLISAIIIPVDVIRKTLKLFGRYNQSVKSLRNQEKIKALIVIDSWELSEKMDYQRIYH